MCMYCNDVLRAPLIVEKNFIAYIGGRSLTVEYERGDWHRVKTDINYCPMCGRDLREEA